MVKSHLLSPENDDNVSLSVSGAHENAKECPRTPVPTSFSTANHSQAFHDTGLHICVLQAPEEPIFELSRNDEVEKAKIGSENASSHSMMFSSSTDLDR